MNKDFENFIGLNKEQIQAIMMNIIETHIKAGHVTAFVAEMEKRCDEKQFFRTLLAHFYNVLADHMEKNL